MLLSNLSVFVLSLATHAAAGQVSTGEPPKLRPVVQRSIEYLEKEGAAWKKKQGCASCHHVPVMIWALSEANNEGYSVNEKLLNEMTAWSLAAENHTEVFPDLPQDKNHTETDYLGPLLLALGSGAIKDPDAAVKKGRGRLLALAVSQQDKDGSWHANAAGRPPIHASKDVQTSWLLLALSHPADAASDRWKSQREAAAAWLSRNPHADSPQGLAMRLLVNHALGRPAASAQPLLEALFALQNDDGGWSQTKAMKSDAFATGLALYVIAGQRSASASRSVQRAQAFLAKTQQEDGSWPMTSRAAEPTGPGPARSLGPIRFFGAGWGALGLVRSAPKLDD
jgi:hypothetical protein